MYGMSTARHGNARVSPFNKRRGQSPIPLNLIEYLNTEQMESLRQMESFGWELAFIRRPINSSPTVIVSSTDGSTFGVLELDGSINTHSSLAIR